MINKKILLVTTYPIKKPAHGGQKRSRAIYEVYKENFAEVVHAAVFFKGFYSDYDATDIPLSRSSETQVMQSPLTGDIISGQAIYDDPAVKKKMTAQLKALNPDIIHIEQPYPYIGLKPLLAELHMSPKIVFGSQNIEAPMKREILEGYGVSEPIIHEIAAEITAVEEELAQISDVVVTCTKSDMEVHKTQGAKRIVLAPNGINAITTDPQATSYWQTKFSDIDIQHIVLFVGSAHPPNWAGFMQMVGKGLGFIPPTTRIVVAGSISDFFERDITADNLDIEDATFWLRAISAGRLSEDRLGALIKRADVIILPITEGGGSNLKTAEAIMADKKVVATSHALRSFEWARALPNLWIADTKTAFQRTILEALATPKKDRTAAQKKDARQVEWHNCLADMVKIVGTL